MGETDKDIINFVNFMKKHQIKKGDSETLLTHTAMGPIHPKLHPWKGNYSIIGPDYEKFIDLYQLAVGKMDMHIVERPSNPVVPVFIDIDFNFTKKLKERQYLDKHIEAIVEVYNDLFKECLNISDDELKAFVFEKPSPTFEEKKTGSRYKDGFHILYPEVPLDVKKRYYFFDKAKEQIIEKDIFGDIDFTNTYEDILDMSVISSNGILMYGAQKPDREPYGLTKIYNHDMTIEELDNYDDDDLVGYLSLQKYCDDDEIQFVTDSNLKQKSRNDSDYDSSDEGNNSKFDSRKTTKSRLDKECDDIYEKYVNPKKSKGKKSIGDYIDQMGDFSEYRNYEEDGDNQKVSNKVAKDNTKAQQKQFVGGKQMDIEMAIGFTRILNKKRCTEYRNWMEVGWALYSVSPSLLPTFIEFSKRAPEKYESGCCEKVWKSASEHGSYGSTISSLFWWARQDNYEQYLDVLRRQINPLITEAKSGTHDDVANVVYQMYKSIFKCISIQKNIWYEFQGDSWVLLDSAYTLIEKITSEVTCEFFKFHGLIIGCAQSSMGQSTDQDEYIKQSGKIQKLYEKLKNNAYVKQVVECCARKFYDKTFEKSLNSNRMIIGFNNGIYDLQNKCFRRGTPDDLLSMTTGYDYKEYKHDSPEIKKIEKYFSQVQREDDMKGYVLRLIASFLDGRIKDQKFILWTGHGCHAVDEEIRMFDGSSKKVQDIELRDKVLGPDGRERRVCVIYHDKYDMYTVYANDQTCTTFKVTGNHRLALRCHYKPTIVQTHDDIGNIQIYWVRHHILTHDGPIQMETQFYDIESAIKFIKSLENSEVHVEYGQVIPISIEEYQTISPEISKYYKLFKHTSEMDFDSSFFIEKFPEKQEYYGIELDGDKKYVMTNGYVTFNSNGKSTTISLIHGTLGDYGGVLSSQVVTRKRGGSGQATPDLADKNGKRFLVIQEPDHDDQIYVGAMKELSAGNDEIPVRALYGNPFVYKPQFKMVLCCNKLPHIPSNDGGTWRRLRVTPWEAQFMDLDYPRVEMKSHQFYKDPNLEDDMKKWPQPFAWLLLNKYYPDYCERGLMEPAKVKDFTNKYKKDSDFYMEYLNDFTELTGDEKDTETMIVIYRYFKAWFKEAYNEKPPAQKEFSNYLETAGYVIEKASVKGIRMTLGD
jgi:phage/plasmid-associated DNA primase